MIAGFGIAGRLVAPPITAATWPTVAATQVSFPRFLMQSFHPLVQGPKSMVSQAATEVLVSVGVSYTGEKYEALLNLLISRLVDVPVERMAERLAKLRATVRATIDAETARIEYAQLDKRQYAADVMNRAALRVTEAYIQWQARRRAARDPEVRASLERQAADEEVRLKRWLSVEWLEEQARRLRETLTENVQDVTAREFLQARRALEIHVMPPSLELLERVLRENKDDLFRAGEGLDIERLRVDLRMLRRLATKEERPRLQILEQAIDQARHERFDNALSEFLRDAHGQVEGVILNGARPGDLEYRGIFSDLDFTVLIPKGKDATAVRRLMNAAFEKHGIPLNRAGRLSGADVEGMVQDFLPGETRPIRTEADLKAWLGRLSQDPGRYLSGGGAEWVGLYNHLTGRTVRLRDGKAVIETTRDLTLLPQPELHPILAHGLLLDVARFDKIRDVGSIGDTRTLGELTASRAKYVLRAVDALIWAVYPDRLRARTPEAARRLGYHGLIAADAQVLVERGLLTPAEFETIQYLVDLKAGKTAAQVLGLHPDRLEVGRVRLEQLWNGMNALMRRSYRDTRRVYLVLLEHYARTSGGIDTEGLFTLAFRNWNAARKIRPESLGWLTGRPESGLVDLMKHEDREIITESGGGQEPPEPPVLAAAAGDSPERLPPRQRQDQPDPGSDPHAAPTAPRSARAPPPTPDPPFHPEEIVEPLDLAACEFRGKDGYVYLNGRRVGVEREVDPGEPYYHLNEVAAYLLGRHLGVLVPWAGFHTFPEGHPRAGQRVVVVRWVRSLAPEDAIVPDLLGLVLRLTTRVPDGLDVAALDRFRTPEILARMRTQFLENLLLAVLQGGFDRKSNNHVLALGGEVVGIDHKRSEPFDPAGLKGDRVAALMVSRLQKDPRPFKVAEALGVTLTHVAEVWEAMKTRLYDEKGVLRETELDRVAALYGDQRAAALVTHKARIENMAAALIDGFAANATLVDPKVPPETRLRLLAAIEKRLADQANAGRPPREVAQEVLYGKPEPPAYAKEWEKNPDGTPLRNPTLQTTEGGARITLKPGVEYIWVIDEQGRLRVGEEIVVGKEPDGYPRKLGHPTLTEAADGRIGGELRFDPQTGTWRVNNASGRYARHPDRGPDQLRAAAEALRAAGIAVGEVEYKHKEGDQNPPPRSIP
jgi:hypothetical protein